MNTIIYERKIVHRFLNHPKDNSHLDNLPKWAYPVNSSVINGMGWDGKRMALFKHCIVLTSMTLLLVEVPVDDTVLRLQNSGIYDRLIDKNTKRIRPDYVRKKQYIRLKPAHSFVNTLSFMFFCCLCCIKRLQCCICY